MCGITGVLNISNDKPIDPYLLHAANNTMYHRGPDDEGFFVQPDFGMAMRRLSIIDVYGGHQPISNEDSTVHIVCNGEIYNYRDIRLELQSQGHRFRTKTDTEVMVHAYEQWDIEGLLDRLRGMFAFALWDSKAQALLLARDRMGIKPLYYAEHGGRFYFGSEIRGILLHSEMPKEVDLQALDEFMVIGFTSTPRTLFKGIKKLPPAHYLTIKNQQISIKKYWEISYNTFPERSKKELVEEFRENLSECVKMHLMSDVPLGALLSGGIDSITNVALIQRFVRNPVQTITLSFEAKSYDEAEKAAKAAAALGTDHHTVVFRNDTLDEYPRLLYYREEPVADATFTTLYYLFQACHQHGLTVVLTGEGADELLGGYSWHHGDHRVRAFIRLPHLLRIIATRTPVIKRRYTGIKFEKVLHRTPQTVHRRYQSWISIGDADLSETLLSPEIRSAIRTDHLQFDPDCWSEYLSPVRGQHEFHQMLWLQSRTRLADWVNTGIDRMSMAHSIEARPPFLDHKLWEFCATIPPGLKLHSRYFRLTEKYILREAGRNLVPDSTRRQKKKPLTAPYPSWLAQPALPEWAETALSSSQIKKVGLFDPESVSRLRTEYQSGARSRATLLMGVLALQTWAHLFLQSPIGNGPPEL